MEYACCQTRLEINKLYVNVTTERIQICQRQSQDVIVTEEKWGNLGDNDPGLMSHGPWHATALPMSQGPLI